MEGEWKGKEKERERKGQRVEVGEEG